MKPSLSHIFTPIKQYTCRSRTFVRMLAFSLWVVLLLSGCSAPLEAGSDIVVHRPLSAQTQYLGEETIYAPSQVTVGWVRPEDRHTTIDQLPQNDEFRIAEGKPLSLDLILSTGQDATFLVTLLVDYEQTSFLLDGQIGLLHEVDVRAGRYLFIPFQVDIPDPGAHDLTVIAFRDPYQRPMDQDIRSHCVLGGNRAVVIVGENEQPVQTVSPDATGNPPPPGVDWGVALMFANPGDVHPSQAAGQMSLTQHGQPGQVFNYKIWMSNLGNVEQEPEDFGLVRFLNYRQIDFKGKNLFVVHLDEKQEILIEDSLVLPEQAGVNEVQIVYVVDPYKSLLHGDVSLPFVYKSDCLGIEVP